MAALEELEHRKAFGGEQGVYRHQSDQTKTPMTFAVFTPPGGGKGRPVVTYLSGLTCTHANVMDKGEYRRVAAELGLVIVCPDTSPRGHDVPSGKGIDFGKGAGFYVDAVRTPFAANYRMWSYVTKELPAVVAEHFAVDTARQGVFGHSMGGHGALIVGLRNLDAYRSISAFAPIASPSRSPWGKKAFKGYLGGDRKAWRAYDAVALIEDGARPKDLFVDIGTADPFIGDQLKPDLLEEACAKAGVPLTLRRQEGYDHSYLFISTFMEDHLRWHAERLG